MEYRFSAGDLAALFGLLADNAMDIVIKTDRRGFVTHATAGFERLGPALSDQLIGPHLAELAHPGGREALASQLSAALKGRQVGCRGQFPALVSGGRAWFDFQLRSLADSHGQVTGTIGVFREITDSKLLEEKIFASQMTDSLTGLTNRRAFCGMIDHLVRHDIEGSVILLSLDRFAQVNRRLGQAAGDRVLIGFADVLRSTLSRRDIISRVGGQRFAVIMPHVAMAQAEAAGRELVHAWRELGAGGAFDFAASAGVTPIERSLDHTIDAAERALLLARACGGNRIAPAGKARPRYRPAGPSVPDLRLAG